MGAAGKQSWSSRASHDPVALSWHRCVKVPLQRVQQSMPVMKRKKKKTTKVSMMAGRDPRSALMIIFTLGSRFATRSGRRMRKVLSPASAELPSARLTVTQPSATTFWAAARTRA